MHSNTPQGTHVYVLTLENQRKSACTLSGTYTPPPGATRWDVLSQLRFDAVRQYPSMESAIVLYFALEANRLDQGVTP
ncbi:MULTISPECIES: hypothetical protein [Streptomyces]|uniref:Uncharacterized protein n=1 Tax=Streptomyces venezuelae (strain ATCC 10712 / CBS 650.69 / DSM 40230 / JCM 4526 / NBRC 13096 / PD 04745) TaxID=953739 RepID=F2R3C5_STRVP|nr:hypothetical protein [Streptomyces venezuelae]APE21700.1 hypothetical protein vnz_12160 [Streptomyces venezuelae]QER99082.1 hypothetical protein DEJ43_12300 [Streptomyces venezuelae ATCC 10712]CCA55767.1 hypothetical protein SVEN_2481 [Streptomyces venezuelae ATCC 10712]